MLLYMTQVSLQAAIYYFMFEVRLVEIKLTSPNLPVFRKRFREFNILRVALLTYLIVFYMFGYGVIVYIMFEHYDLYRENFNSMIII